MPRLSFRTGTALASATIVAICMLIAGWQRRWISDDGLIILRTVRNLQAGNGPVFNAGERVEANTSTLWQYLIYAVAQLSDGRLETVALWTALICTGLAIFIGILGTGILYSSQRIIFVPLGMAIYVVLPPARDFATSGLEWGLSLLWVSVLWLLLVLWARAAPFPRPSTDKHQEILQASATARHARHAEKKASTPAGVGYALALWAGLSWLVRPELALYGLLTGIVLLIAAGSWRVRALMLLAAVPLPLGYQIFRMGYYGELVPQTAVAKSANETHWGRGWEYLNNFATPYGLWWALGGLALLAAFLLWQAQRSSIAAPTGRRGIRTLRHPAVPVAIIVTSALLHGAYVIRVGGDFMHGRMLLIPLFALLLPLAVVPLFQVSQQTEGTNPEWNHVPQEEENQERENQDRENLEETNQEGEHKEGTQQPTPHNRLRVRIQQPYILQPLVVAAACILGGIFGWYAITHPLYWTDGGNKRDDLNVVDERTYWLWRTHASPQDPSLYAEDYVDMDLLGGFEEANQKCAEERHADAPWTPRVRMCEGALLSIALPLNKDQASTHSADDKSSNPDGLYQFTWIPSPALPLPRLDEPLQPGPAHGYQDLALHPMTISFLNLGVSGMIAPLDVRVVDPMGLANPLAARMPQINNGRPGHDKYLALEWQMADSSVDPLGLPGYVDKEEVQAIRPILYTPDFVQLFRTYREPMSWHRFLANIKFSLLTSRDISFSDDIDDYRDVHPIPDAQIVWRR